LKSFAATVLLVATLSSQAQAGACSTEETNKQTVMRELLSDVAQRGLRGKHYYAITFQTTASGVRIPAQVSAQYPESVTIILQYQFERLLVRPEGFQVTLWFKGVKHKVAVPFDAITSLIDPSVNVRIDVDPARRGLPCRGAGLPVARG
jgi:hypothetical protein